MGPQSSLLHTTIWQSMVIEVSLNNDFDAPTSSMVFLTCLLFIVCCKVIVLDQIMNSEMTHFVFCGLSSLFCAAELLIVFLLFKNKPYCWFTPKVSAISLIGLFFQSKDGTCVSIMRHYKNAHLSVNWPTNFEHLSWMSVLLSFSLPIYNYCI